MASGFEKRKINKIEPTHFRVKFENGAELVLSKGINILGIKYYQYFLR